MTGPAGAVTDVVKQPGQWSGPPHSPAAVVGHARGGEDPVTRDAELRCH